MQFTHHKMDAGQKAAVVQAVRAGQITLDRALSDYGAVPRSDAWERDNLLEMQQMLYVAATRPSQALMLVGV
jgi:hypothetical protein